MAQRIEEHPFVILDGAIPGCYTHDRFLSLEIYFIST